MVCCHIFYSSFHQSGNVSDYFFEWPPFLLKISKPYKQNCKSVHSLFGYLNDNFNIYSLKYVINLIFRLFFNVCAIVILQAETPFNIRFWNGPSCKQETKTTAPADVYKAWNPKGWQTLRKAQAYFSWYYASVLL